MREKIGVTAGNVWNILKDRQEVAITRLPGLLNERCVVVYQALGWLAREDKIGYRHEANRTYVFLTEEEKLK